MEFFEEHRNAEATGTSRPDPEVDDQDYPYTVQIVSAKLTPDSPHGVPARAGRTYLQLQIVVKSGLPGRSIGAPTGGDLSVLYPACLDDLITCTTMEYGTDYYTGEQVAVGDEGKASGIEDFSGKLEPGIPYYRTVWGNVKEGTDLSSAQLCNGIHSRRACIPLGTVDQA